MGTAVDMPSQGTARHGTCTLNPQELFFSLQNKHGVCVSCTRIETKNSIENQDVKEKHVLIEFLFSVSVVWCRNVHAKFVSIHQYFIEFMN